MSLSELNESRKDIRTVPFVFVLLKYIQDIRYGYLCLRYDINICSFKLFFEFKQKTSLDTCIDEISCVTIISNVLT
jgi:hypothetical protein